MTTNGVELADKPSTSAARKAPSGPRRFGGKTAAGWLTAYGAVFVLVVMVVVFSILIPDTYPTWRNAQAILGAESVVLMVSLGLLIPAVVGEFDLSVGSMVAFAAIEMASLVGTGIPFPVAIVLTLLSAALIGLGSGFLVVRVGVSSFIATLAVGTLLTGGALWISGGQIVVENIPTSVTDLGQGDLFGIPLPAIYAAVLVAVFWYVLSYTPVGRRLYVTGGNRLAAELSGVPTKRLVTSAFVVSATIAAFGGIVTMMRTGAGDPTVGPDLLLPAFAAVFLGSTTIVPGRFNVMGTVVGILLVACGVSGLQQLGTESFVVPLFNGFVLLVAVTVTRILKTSRASG
jgi:ribose transport system permease protein